MNVLESSDNPIGPNKDLTNFNDQFCLTNVTHEAMRTTSEWRRAKARNVSLKTLYSGQFTLLIHMIILNYPNSESGASFFGPIIEQNKEKIKHFRITFDTKLNIELLHGRMVLTNGKQRRLTKRMQPKWWKATNMVSVTRWGRIIKLPCVVTDLFDTAMLFCLSNHPLRRFLYYIQVRL